MTFSPSLKNDIPSPAITSRSHSSDTCEQQQQEEEEHRETLDIIRNEQLTFEQERERAAVKLSTVALIAKIAPETINESNGALQFSSSVLPSHQHQIDSEIRGRQTDTDSSSSS